MSNSAPARPVVLFLWSPPDALRRHLIAGVGPAAELVFPPEPDVVAETVAKRAAEADILVGWRPDDKLLADAERLALIINPGAGVQHLLPQLRSLNAERDEPVALANGHGNSVFTAQGSVALLLALCNRVVRHHGWMVEGGWRKGDGDAATWPLQGRKIGLLGYGAVNRWTHRFLAGFPVEFSALRRHWPEQEREAGPGETAHEPPTPLRRYTQDQLHDFLERIDILMTALPLTPDTEGMLDAEAWRRLGPDGLLVHVARGPIADEAALYAALAEERIAGAAIDVWWDYQPQPDAEGKRYPYDSQRHPFHELPNVVLSPHRAASPFSDLNRWNEVVENIRRFASGRPLLNIVDLDQGY